MCRITIKNDLFEILSDSDLYKAAILMTETEGLNEKQLDFANKRALQIFRKEIFILKDEENGKTNSSFYR